MREILFRGKSVNGTGWFEGALRIVTIQPADKEAFKQYEIEDTTLGVFPNDFMSGFCEIVVPETVGQFTGLTDKNGKKIFEGDIVAYCWYEDEPMNFQIEFVSGEFIAVPVKKREGVWAIRIYGLGENLEIIGNIHDNPELLEVDA